PDQLPRRKGSLVEQRGKYRFGLKASNGQIIATGEAYESKAACMNGIKSIQTNAPGAKIQELTSA
ncbi:YegP family protein, partial [Yinghuangia sp. YIM S09857]|uniref:YegP family protein n=1 Tax=Yinghuangia sp. YIM S09857 TaxID=3436929 RepID=UPI003F52BF5D